MTAAPLLVLFDIDGSLLLDDRHAHGRAMLGAAQEVWDIELDAGAVDSIGPWGKTDRRIIREVLVAAGVEDDTVTARQETWMALAARRFALSAVDSSPRWLVRPGLTAGLRRLLDGGARLAPLTGDLRAIALVKLERMNVAGAFAMDAGAYGDDSEDHPDLPPLARTRAGGHPRERTVIVGDAAADLTAARADGLRCVLFDGPRLDADTRNGADDVVPDMRSLVDLLHPPTFGGAVSHEKSP